MTAKRGGQGGPQNSWIGVEWKEVEDEPETQRKGVKGTVYLNVCVCVYTYIFCVGIGTSVRVYSMLELGCERV